ncbi:hypothetical protein VmeM32_00162 [Vibrio phage vB_VmeM-32]|nr:hypothetical protein VmeM32_00162 [Vibrio phage vB_VmeM-32]
MLRVITIILSMLLISGCASEPVVITQTVYKMPTVFVPHRPQPISNLQFNGVMIEHNQKPYYGIEYNDSIEFRKWLEEIRTYIQKQNVIIEHYESIHKNKVAE